VGPYQRSALPRTKSTDEMALDEWCLSFACCWFEFGLSLVYRLQIDGDTDENSQLSSQLLNTTHISHCCFEFNHDGNYFHFRNQLIPVHYLLSFPFHPLISSIQPPGYEDLTKTICLPAACLLHILPSVRHPHLLSTTLPLSLPSVCQITTKHPNTENTR
jgi:hypothetical protein